jgi:hypothetical protein
MTLSVRLPVSLEKQLFDYCKKNGLSKTQAVQQALNRFFVQPKAQFSIDPADPLSKWVGIIKKGPSTDELMRMTRGDDWNQA